MKFLKINVDFVVNTKIFYLSSLPLFYRDSFLIIVNFPVEK